MHPLSCAGKHPRGFALVVTVSLLVLLSVICVGLLGLSAVSLRASTQTQAQAEAQANARLALMLAMGELQQLLGPDPNITAPASIFDADPETSGVAGLKHRHLTGVWQARNETLDQTPDYSRDRSFRRWLVSNANDEAIQMTGFVRDGSLADPVAMVDVSDNPAEGAVQAGRLPVRNGSLAWWVGDENCKALINPRDASDRKDSHQAAELLAGFASPGAHGVVALEGFGDFPSNTPVSNPAWNSGVTRITPVVVRLQMLISFGVERQGTSNNYNMRMFSYPVVTLWNPHNVPMRVTEWSTFLHTLPLEHTIYKAGVKHYLGGGGTRNGNYNWGWPHGNMTLRVGGSTGPSIMLAPGEAKTLTYSISRGTAHDMIVKPPAWLPTRAGQPRSLGIISGSPTDRIAISTALATWETSSTSYAGQNFQTTFDFRCEPRAIHDGHSWRKQGQMFSSQVGWRHEAANPRIAFISERNFPSTTLQDLNNNPMPFLHLDIRLKTLDEPMLPNKTWLHNIPCHPYASVTSTSRHSLNGVDASTPFFAHPFTITFEQVNGVEGVFQNRPFFGPSNRPGGQSRIVSAPVPLAR